MKEHSMEQRRSISSENQFSSVCGIARGYLPSKLIHLLRNLSYVCFVGRENVSYLSAEPTSNTQNKTRQEQIITFDLRKNIYVYKNSSRSILVILLRDSDNGEDRFYFLSSFIEDLEA